MRAVNGDGTRTPTAFLRALIADAGGSISVERFMQEALYHPVYGYYARTVQQVGRTGDFSTTATLHSALGRAISTWVKAHQAEVQHGGRWHLVELGGGGGQMAAQILDALGWWGRRGLQYHVVDVSSGLRAEQAKRLGDQRGKVRWHTDLLSVLHAAEGRVLIFSNEFVDAFPCVQLERDASAGRWREVRVAWPAAAAKPHEVLVEWEGPEPEFTVNAQATSQRVEIHRSYRAWLSTWVASWQSGRMLTIDYGDHAPALYDRRPRGTLRAYFRQMRLAGVDVYERFGQQDITADVNFSDLQSWSGELGLERGTVCTQAAFLQRWISRQQYATDLRDPIFAQLLDPSGAGGAFKVLEQSR